VESKFHFPIILASTSPRRIELLNQVHLPFEVQPPQTDETPLAKEKPARLVARLALEKAESVRKSSVQRHEACLIIAADTLVVAPCGRAGNEKILNKPKDVDDARKSLRILSGKTHSVLTGYCILLASSNPRKNKQVLRVVQSKVKMRLLNQSLIESYVQSGEPMDKAGAYAAQGLGMALIEKIEGSYTNVVGLPMTQVLADLEKTFKINLFSWVK